MPIQGRLSPQEAWRRRLYLPAYRVADAARYAGTNSQTVAYWHYRGGQLGPALPGKEHRAPLSWLQLVEVAFVATFRGLGVPLQRIRKAREYMAQVFSAEYPFAQLDLQTEGHHVLMDMVEIEPEIPVDAFIIADIAGQTAWQPMVADRFAQFDYEHGLAVVWHVAGRQSRVIMDPRISFGAPTMRGIPTWALKGRFGAGESIDDISEDFSLERPQVVEALEFEGVETAA
jgi:uncharacterized protein (DUF433 family)